MLHNKIRHASLKNELDLLLIWIVIGLSPKNIKLSLDYISNARMYGDHTEAE